MTTVSTIAEILSELQLWEIPMPDLDSHRRAVTAEWHVVMRLAGDAKLSGQPIPRAPWFRDTSPEAARYHAIAGQKTLVERIWRERRRNGEWA